MTEQNSCLLKLLIKSNKRQLKIMYVHKDRQSQADHAQGKHETDFYKGIKSKYKENDMLAEWLRRRTANALP